MVTDADSFSAYGSRFNTYRILSRRVCFLLLARTMIHGLKEVCVRLNSSVIASELRPELHACGAVVFYHGPMVDSNIETEAKWRVDEGEHERFRTELRRAGLRTAAPSTRSIRRLRPLEKVVPLLR